MNVQFHGFVRLSKIIEHNFAQKTNVDLQRKNLSSQGLLDTQFCRQQKICSQEHVIS